MTLGNLPDCSGEPENSLRFTFPSLDVVLSAQANADCTENYQILGHSIGPTRRLEQPPT